MHDVVILALDNIISEEYFKFLALKDLSSTDQPLEELEKTIWKLTILRSVQCLWGNDGQFLKRWIVSQLDKGISELGSIVKSEK